MSKVKNKEKNILVFLGTAFPKSEQTNLSKFKLLLEQ